MDGDSSSEGVSIRSASREEGERKAIVPFLEAPAEQSCPLNPNLSCLISLLEDDDDDAASSVEANLSPGMLDAYHSTACQVASILQEDSPGLNLNIDLRARPSIPSSSPAPASNSGYRNYQFAPARNQLIQNRHFAVASSWPPRALALPPYPVPGKLLDEELFKHVSAMTTAGHIANNNWTSRCDRDHRKAIALKPRKDVYKASAVLKWEDTCLKLNELLLQCADATEKSDTKTAKDALLKLKKFACPHGDGAERMAYYFADALELRLQGTGQQVYSGQMRQQRASPKDIYDASWMYMVGSPIAQAFRYFVNQTILSVVKGASILHIMEYQFTGIQYPSLFKELAERPGGPPQVRLIAGNVPHYSLTSIQMEILSSKLEKTGCFLKACASNFGVPFHFIPWVGKTGDFEMRDYVNPNRGPEEVLVILSVYPLRHINEDLLSPPEKRLRILQAVRSMNPEAFIRGFVTASYNTPFFRSRFREALNHFEYQYDMLDTFIERDNPHRLIFESEILGRAILSLVAYEEPEMVEKAEKYYQCYASMKRVGLEQLPLNQKLHSQVETILRSLHKNYFVFDDLNHLLMGWKGRMLHAITVWKGPKVSNEQQ